MKSHQAHGWGLGPNLEEEKLRCGIHASAAQDEVPWTWGQGQAGTRTPRAFAKILTSPHCLLLGQPHSIWHLAPGVPGGKLRPAQPCD